MTVGTDITLATLTPYLEAHVPQIGTSIALDKFSGGQSNPTFKLTTNQGRFVLRAKPSGTLLKSAHLVEREYRVMDALYTTDVPVPKMLHLASDSASPIGRAFFVMEYLEGRVFWDPTVPDVNNDARREVYAAMGSVLGQLHSILPSAVGLETFGKAGNYFARQLERWGANYHASIDTPTVEMQQIMSWLEREMPSDDGQIALVHGDFRLDNLMIAPDTSDVIGVLDWELSTLGHPMADLAYQCMQLRLPYGAGMRGLGGQNRAELGIPSEADYVQAYAEARRIEGPKDWEFYLVFSYFRLIAILQGVVRRAQMGNGSNPRQAAEFAQAIPILETQATKILKDGADV
jgi:aminoglycoside phosphotransferase (APT) family kinase protein